MKYMLLIYDQESFYDTLPEKQAVEVMSAFGSFTEALKKSGAYIDGQRLSPVATATTVRKRAKDLQVADGPFAETKEQLGGFYMIEAPDLDGALKWAKQCPGAWYGSVEVRPVMENPNAP
jgi:hypothetical protein